MFTVLIYIAAIVAANLTVVHFGPWFSPINAFLLIGMDLTLRDHLHERWRGSMLWPRMLGIIAAAGALSFALNPATGVIAVASVVAFCAAALVDAAVYQAASRWSFIQRANASNAAGALADSIIFPTIAFGGLMPEIVMLQFSAKVAGGAVWAFILWRVMARAAAAIRSRGET